jgi:geranylgeranyl pyrophosphate synthase
LREDWRGLGTSTPEQRAALRDYGFDLGIAFQIVDDVLDFVADEARFGKPLGGDLREGKVTLPIILLLQRTGPKSAEMVARSSPTGSGAGRLADDQGLLAREGASRPRSSAR